MDAVNEVFPVIARSIKEGTVEKLLNGPVAHGGFKRLA
jgi:hypothetical protein